MRATRAYPSRPESLAEAVRSVFEGPKPTNDQGSRSRSPRGRLERFWTDFGSIWSRFAGVRSVWRIGRGGSRSHFVEIDFFCFRERLGLDLAPPRSPFGGSLTLLERSLGPTDHSLGAPVGSKDAFCPSLGAALGASGGTLGRSGVPLGLLMAPWPLWGPLWVDLGSIFD